ncbi:hypothetical protein MNBD_GAMMA04-1864 [hydrothermal vent metagenome]|uniref:Uncharacterized protein n=1 Tax=hydrothermal vent metagenome TaxID=652676 RepID=A0A3B0VSK4_9ZZZZ
MKTAINTFKITTLASTLVFASLFFSPPLLAGANHNHGDDHGHSHAPEELNQKAIKQKATEIIHSLIEKNKIDPSWATISANSAEKKSFDNRMEWVVIFNNPKITDMDKQKLYVFLTLNGEYIAANYTGN